MKPLRIDIIRRLILFAIFFVTGPLTSSRAQPAGIDVSGQNFVGDFYCEPSAIPRPGILLLGGSEGGRPIKHWPMLLAQNGYAVPAVAYFKERGLPNTLEMIPLEYVDTPIAWLRNHTNVVPGSIFVWGGSKGAELTLLLASRKPEIQGIIALSPCSVVWAGIADNRFSAKSSLSLHGQPLPFVPYDLSAGFEQNDPLATRKLYERSLA